MKTFCLSTIIAVFLLICFKGLQAQTTQTKLNQIELMKQIIGTWKCDIAKDTVYFFEAKAYGTGIEGNPYYVTKGKTVIETTYFAGYDEMSDKFVMPWFIKGNGIGLYVVWFLSNNKYEIIPYKDISNPEKASTRWEAEFKSHNLLVEKVVIDNKLIRTDTYTRVK